MANVLNGIRIIEFAGLGPAPFCGMHLADLGADVVVLENKAVKVGNLVKQGNKAITKRGKRIVQLDLKDPDDLAKCKQLIEKADGLIEGFRPGVMERLGLGPDVCFKINPKLVYGRVTGWGQTGPLSKTAGHDINYTSLSGAAWYSGQAGTAPTTPPTLLGDVAGGALYLMIGMLSALLNVKSGGQGQVVDAAMVDSNAHMLNLLLSLKAMGQLPNERGKSLLDGPHWYTGYKCADGKFLSVGALEPKFYQQFLQILGLESDPHFKEQYNPTLWVQQKQKLGQVFSTKTQHEWMDLFTGSDACVSPILNIDEAAQHSHMLSRNAFSIQNTVLHGMPAPRFSNSDQAKINDCINVKFSDIDWF